MKRTLLLLSLLLAGCTRPNAQIDAISGNWGTEEQSEPGRIVTTLELAKDRTYTMDVKMPDLQEHQTYKGTYSVSDTNLTLVHDGRRDTLTIVSVTSNELRLKGDATLVFSRK